MRLISILKQIFGGFREPTEQEVATVIENFVNGTSGPRDWDDFISFRYGNPVIEAARIEWPEGSSAYFSPIMLSGFD